MTQTSLSLTVDNSYSQALYELVEEDRSISQVEKEAGSLIKLLSESHDFVNLIRDPRNTQSDQTNAINAICVNFKFNNTFAKFLKFLISKRRLFYLEKILRDFLTICSVKRGEVVAKLIASKILSNSELDNIKNSLKENFGSNLKLKFVYDPSLIGGLIVQVGSIMIDTSIKNKLKQIENNMIEV